MKTRAEKKRKAHSEERKTRECCAQFYSVHDCIRVEMRVTDVFSVDLLAIVPESLV